MKLCNTALVAAAIAAAVGTAALGAAGDEASSPIPLAGNTTFNYNSANWTTSPVPVFSPACFPNEATGAPFHNDVWICWTASCNGIVTVSACGIPGEIQGTRIAMWQGCADPTADGTPHEPYCCNDNGCEKDAVVSCDVLCGQSYLFRIGLDPGVQAVSRTITFQCEGTPCDTGGNDSCPGCCARPPRVTNFNAPVLVGTSHEDQLTEKVVHVFDASQFNSQTPGPWPTIPVYEHPDWTYEKLGTVFGVTVDKDGNIYVAHTAVYNFGDRTGTVGGGGAGAIYKLDSASGTPSRLCKLPNIETCTPVNSCAPGLGNLTYSCDYDCIYCSDFEDGRIYRIKMDGTLLEAYDFGDQAIESAAPDTSDVAGAAPFGQRTWGVAIGRGRMYFSVVREDMSFGAAGTFNEIWSIPLSGTGAFASGTATLEIQVPDFQGNVWSNPVADIAFDGDCCMYLAERSMYGPSQTQAHNSRLLKYCLDAQGRWVLNNAQFETGCCGIPYSDAGGVGVDQGANGLVWTTSDAMLFGPTYYGIIGLPTTGGLNNQGILIDMNGDVSQQDKTYVGSVEVACRVTDVCTSSVTATCHLGPDGLPDGQYELSITVHNGMEGAVANYVLLPDLGTFVNLNPPLQPGETRKVMVVTNQLSPGPHSMDIGLFNGMCNECSCCGIIGVEFDVPECECMILHELTVNCYDDRDPTTYWYDITFTLRNISPYVARHLFMLPQTAGVTTVPQYVQLPFLAPGQTYPIAFTIQFPGPPPVGADGKWHVSISMAMLAPNLSLCCKKLIDFSGPVDCASPVFADLNNDLHVDGSDLGILLGDWGTTPVGGCLADLNGDGEVDGTDLGLFLAAWAP
ncbi:MAG: hypothetical protein U0636_09360 [Phycisphaerales bacterium]